MRMDNSQAPDPHAGTRRWWTTKKVLGSSISIMLVASAAVTAAILFQQDVNMTTSAQDSDVRFVDGGGGLLGFATASIEDGGASATLSLTGISGALMQVTDLLQIQNTDATQAYEVMLSRSAAPAAAIESLVITVLDGATVIRSYDVASDASAASFTLPAGSTYDLRFTVDVAAGTPAGALGDLALHFSISPV